MKVSYSEVRSRMRNLSLLSDRVCEFTYKTYNINYIIMCEGNILSNCIVIGEAPGQLEERFRRILVGESGKLVRRILKKYGIENKVMFLNVVPWRPQNNDTPSLAQIKSYIALWKELFNILSIEYILCLGATAKKLIKFSQNNFNAKSVFETWHPAYYLRTHKDEHLEDIDTNILHLKNNINCNNTYCYIYFIREFKE